MEQIDIYQAKICWIVARLQNTQLEVLNTSAFALNNEHEWSFQMIFWLVPRFCWGGEALGERWVTPTFQHSSSIFLTFRPDIHSSSMKYGWRIWIWIWIKDTKHKINTSYTDTRGGICHSRHCRQQCKIFASGVFFSIFTHFSCFLAVQDSSISDNVGRSVWAN